jgi:hypothetical protein
LRVPLYRRVCVIVDWTNYYFAPVTL